MGPNVLAIQGLNVSAADSDFLILPELVATSVAFDQSLQRYFTAPTPGGPNGYASTVSSFPVLFNHHHGRFHTSLRNRSGCNAYVAIIDLGRLGFSLCEANFVFHTQHKSSVQIPVCLDP